MSLNVLLDNSDRLICVISYKIVDLIASSLLERIMSKICCLAITVLLLVNICLGQTPKGKLTGKVVDGETKEPLIGASVMVEGTKYGAITDADGNYIIINVEPGEYSVSASMVGYRKVITTHIIVAADRTTDVNFTLLSTPIEQQPVVVVGQRPIVVRDRTSTESLVTAREITTAPIQGIRGILDLSSAIQRNPNGTYSVRGGGPLELRFQINGIDQVQGNTGVPGYNAAFGERSNTSWKYDVNPLGVEQLEVITGGFSAEYGNAQSGVVKVVTKEGGSKFSGQIRYEYRPPGKYHFGPYLFGPQTVEWQDWGTFDKWLAARGTIPGFPNVSDDSLRVLYNKWVQNHSPAPDGGANQIGVYDYRKLSYNRFLFGFGGPLGAGNGLTFYASGEYRASPARIPSIEQVQIYQDYNLTLAFHPTELQKLRFTTMYQEYKGSVWSGSDDIRWASIMGQFPNYKYYTFVDSPKDELTTTQSVTWTNMLSKRTFFELTLWHQVQRVIERNMPTIRRTDPSLVPPGVWDENFSRIPYDEQVTSLYALDARDDIWHLSFDYTSQINKTNLLKTGLKLEYWDTRYSGESGARLNALITYSGFAEYYHAYPLIAAIYFQDKMEYEGMVANIGLRGDAYNFGTRVPVDIFRPFYPGTGNGGTPFNGDRGNPETKPSKTFYMLSPRVGVSFPIGERTAFRLQYGHFYSMPIFRQAISKTTTQGWWMYADPNLGPRKTISYEVGVQQNIAGTHRLDVAAFYNDRVNQTVTVRIHSPVGSQVYSPQNDPYYVSYRNYGFGSSQGIEINFDKVALGRWNYRLSYTFQRTTYGAYGSPDIYPDPNDPRLHIPRSRASEYVTPDDRTHTFRAILSYALGKEEGLRILDIYPFEMTDISVIYAAQSGIPFTFPPNRLDGVTNNRRYPLESKVDLSIQKRLAILGLNALLGIRVQNLFNNKWLTPLDGYNQQMVSWVNYDITRDTPAKSPTDPQYDVYKFYYFETYRNVPTEVYFIFGIQF